MMDVGTLLKAKGDRIVAVGPAAPIAVAVDRMRRDAIGALVISSDGRNPLRLLSERDVLHGLAKHGADLLDLRVRDVMSQPAPTCSPDDGLKHAMRLMTTKRATSRCSTRIVCAALSA